MFAAERLRRNQRPPKSLALVFLGHRELDTEREAAAKGLVDPGIVVGGEDRDARERLHALQQVVRPRGSRSDRRDVFTSVRLANSESASSNSSMAWPSSAASKTCGEVLLGLADVLRDHAREVDSVEVEAEVAGDEASDHRLAGAGRPENSAATPRPLRDPVAKTPFVDDFAAMAHARDHLAQLLVAIVGEHEIGPALLPFDADAERRELIVDDCAHGDVNVYERRIVAVLLHVLRGAFDVTATYPVASRGVRGEVRRHVTCPQCRALRFGERRQIDDDDAAQLHEVCGRCILCHRDRERTTVVRECGLDSGCAVAAPLLRIAGQMFGIGKHDHCAGEDRFAHDRSQGGTESFG